MFTLRKIEDQNNCLNTYLGKKYQVYRKRDENYETSFDFHFKNLFSKPEQNDSSSVFAILETEEELIPLYKHFKYYIVTEKGKTFENLSFWGLKGEK